MSTLPPQGSTPEQQRAQETPKKDGQRKPWRILVVDDSADIVTVIRRLLTAQGYETLEAGDGNEGLELAREEKPDLILLDWMLPGISGLDVCRELKRDPQTRGIMILLITGRGSIDSRVEGFDAGADDYISKPFNYPEFLARIRSALRLKELTDDLAERNRQLIESQNELVRTEKMATIGLLASGIAHEFNNIMAGISGYAQLARKNPKHLEQLVSVALTQTERAMELTRSLSTLHRHDPSRSNCDVVKVINSALCLVKKELNSNGIELTTSFEELPGVAISPGQLQEVVLNMIINAIHAIGSDGTITIEGRPKPGHDQVEISISDTGEGIPAENTNRIFDPFFTTKGALGGGKKSGTGLGLSVCYNIVRSRGGDISVTSEIGKGTTFTVTLPYQTEDVVEETAGESPADSVSDSPSRLRILVVDDEGQIRGMLRECLEDHDVVCCARGEEALVEYARQKFDYVLLDICMEDSLSGIETLKELKSLDPQARVIVASGRLPEEIDQRDLEQAHGHLLKPFQFESLAALIGVPIPA